ncbi:phage tail protein I [Pseudovibrio sp. POLY-S9]|uniref:phage tail protein I n=1 Tax=Pseudovibrio sp. POLY-S9 TaxID=1576596 RepID=UPI00070D2379|nr:phage tail protein I [Pseudovibrio sp. POLY-S9]
MRDASSQLPNDATDHERRVASVSFWSFELDQAIADLRDLTNPDKTPAKYLPFLAFEASVDFWDEEWSDDVKRRSIKMNYQIQRHKGTAHAVETALGIIGVYPHILEWWEEDGSGVPGTFEVTAYANEQIYHGLPYLSSKLQEKAIEAVERSKPLSRHFTFTLGAHLESEIGIGMGGRSNAFTQPRGATVLPRSGTTLSIGTMARGVAFVAQTAEPVLPQMGTVLGCAAAARCHSFLSLHGELLT